MRKLTTDEFIKRSRDVHGDRYDYSLTQYNGSKEDVTIICRKHGEFKQCPSVHLKGGGCQKCANEVKSSKLSLGRDRFIERAKVVHGGKYVYPDDMTYVNNSIDVKIICPEHGEFTQTPANHLKGEGCPVCAKKSLFKPRVSKDEFLRRAREVHGDRYDYSKVVYVNMNTPVNIICPEHGEFPQTPKNHVSQKNGCPKCKGRKITESKMYTKEEFIEKAIERHGNKYDYSDVNYVDSKTLVTIKCPKHGNFLQTPVSHLVGRGCPSCAFQLSKNEDGIFHWVKSIDEDAVQRNKKLIKPYEIDIYSPKYNIGIEYDGLIWHSDKFKVDEKYHLEKTEMCNNAGIRLVHIFEDEFVNKRDIVMSRLSSIFKQSNDRIYARQCTVSEAPNRLCAEFLVKNHIQGSVPSKYRYGLFHNGELVAVMTFGALRRNLGHKQKKDEYELLRYCSKLNTTVVGGASKLLMHFIREVEPTRIVSYADRRWSDGNMYEKLGFVHIRNSKPNYFYVVNKQRENRFKYRKDILVKQGFDPNKTEREIMSELGIPRIYDCGTMVFEMKL